MGQKDATLGDHRLFFLLPIGFFGYPFLTHSHMVKGSSIILNPLYIDVKRMILQNVFQVISELMLVKMMF